MPDRFCIIGQVEKIRSPTHLSPKSASVLRVGLAHWRFRTTEKTLKIIFLHTKFLDTLIYLLNLKHLYVKISSKFQECMKFC